jgi:Uma2 family endonuclease
MGMPHTAERWTAEMVRALPDDGNRYELISGELVVTPAPGGLHQAAIRALVRLLDPWLAAGGAAELLWSPADISLGEDELLQPDLFVYRTATRRPIREWSDISELLLVIEVLSPSTARFDRTLKRRRYQRAGVPEYWIVDLDARLIERWRPADSRPEILAERISWRPDAGRDVLEIDLTELFVSIHGD